MLGSDLDERLVVKYHHKHDDVFRSVEFGSFVFFLSIGRGFEWVDKARIDSFEVNFFLEDQRGYAFHAMRGRFAKS